MEAALAILAREPARGRFWRYCLIKIILVPASLTYKQSNLTARETTTKAQFLSLNFRGSRAPPALINGCG